MPYFPSPPIQSIPRYIGEGEMIAKIHHLPREDGNDNSIVGTVKCWTMVVAVDDGTSCDVKSFVFFGGIFYKERTRLSLLSDPASLLGGLKLVSNQPPPSGKITC